MFSNPTPLFYVPRKPILIEIQTLCCRSLQPVSLHPFLTPYSQLPEHVIFSKYADGCLTHRMKSKVLTPKAFMVGLLITCLSTLLCSRPSSHTSLLKHNKQIPELATLSVCNVLPHEPIWLVPLLHLGFCPNVTKSEQASLIILFK